MIEILKYRTDMLFRAGQSNFWTVQWGRSGFSTWVTAMNRHRCGEHRARACEAPLFTLFADQIFGHTLGVFLPPYHIAPSCFTLLLPDTNGFAQHLFSWCGGCHLAARWMQPCGSFPWHHSISVSYLTTILWGASPLTSCTETTAAY